MKQFSYLLVVISVCYTSFHAHSDVIQNGDFSTCTFSGWQTETDGATQVPGANDNFEIIGSGNMCSAKMNVDYELTSDKNTTTTSSNILFQEITNIASVVSLSFSYALETEHLGNLTIVDPETFWVAITDGFNLYSGNGTLGHIISETDIVADQATSIMSVNIDGEYFNSHPANSSNWYIEFGLKVGNKSTSQSDRLGSSLIVDDVLFTQRVVEEVPEPKPFALFLGSLLILSVSRAYGNRR